MNKKDLGQFNTTNSDYILQGFEDHVKGKDILDAFAGNEDLLKWAMKNEANSCYGLDIDPKNKNIAFNNSLIQIPYSKFNLTNPPYLAKNKMSADLKSKYQLNNCEDFYLLSILKIIESNPDEGIIIIPINFFSAENSGHIRLEFLNKYMITKVNYFKKQVFDDTTYNVVVFHYIKKTDNSTKQKIPFTIFPEKTIKSFILDQKYNYRIAGKNLSKIEKIKPLKIIRLTEGLIAKNTGNSKIDVYYNDTKTEKEYFVSKSYKQDIKNNIILLNCIDTNATEEGWIKAEDIRDYNKDCLVGKSSSRNIAYILIPDCPISIQEKIIIAFNDILYHLRKKYKSLFLTNFRDNDRKRVSFDFCYKLISYCYYYITKNLKNS